MRMQSILVTMAGLAVAGASVWFANGQIAQGSARETVAAPELATVWVAAKDVAYGQAITATDLLGQPWPVAAVPEGALTDATLILGDGAQQRRTVQRIGKGELVTLSKLAGFGETVSLVQTLGANTRAVAIKVDAVTAVGGFVTPGDHVDIVLTQGRDTEMRAATILQNIRVIGIDQDADQTSDRAEVARTITVEVSPVDGQKLALAQRAGTLSLTLRTLDGVQDAALGQITIGDLLGDAVIEAAPVAVEPARSVKVRRGNESEVVIVN